jgi:ABC-2 type transport system ATP-binding protein
MIETYGLTKYYGKVRGIENINLKVNSGEIFGFLGPNGSGKTTTIRLLMDFIRPSAGHAEIFGLDAHIRALDVRHNIGNVSSDVALFESLSGHKTLDLTDSLFGRETYKRRQELAERLQVDLSRPIKTLSRGNKQKIALIQALAHDPDLLILDEPTGGLDPFIQLEFLEILGEQRLKGKTVFFSSHLLPEVERICDRVGILRNGFLVAMEQVAELAYKKTRRMEVTLASDQSWPADFEIEGVKVIRRDGSFAELTVSGALQPLLARLGTFEVENLVFPEATLEDTFMAYYDDKDTIT